jgi:hypothetical protein
MKTGNHSTIGYPVNATAIIVMIMISVVAQRKKAMLFTMRARIGFCLYS